MHCSLLVSVSAGSLATITFGDPGIQGAGIAGTHGPGVAEILMNVGQAGEVHKPKGMIFRGNLLSMMVAMGILQVNTCFTGKTTSEEGATPIVHIKVAPLHT
jgi:hypothetical protein